jgi:hypothetical protein
MPAIALLLLRRLFGGFLPSTSALAASRIPFFAFPHVSFLLWVERSF